MKVGKTLYLDESLIDELETECKKTGRSISWVINKFLSENKEFILTYLINGKHLKI